MATLCPFLNDCVSTNSSATVNETLITVDDEWRFYIPRWLTIGILLAGGVLGNSAFLLVVARHQSMRINVTNVYLVNLAIADIIVLIVGYIPIVTEYGPFSSRILGCVFMVIATTSYYTSMSIVSLVAWDRFYAICEPIKHRVTSSTKGGMKRVAAAWCCSLIYCVTMFLEPITKSKGCRVIGKSYKTDGLQPSSSLSDPFKALPFVLCLFLNCCLYARIIHTLRHRFVHRTNHHGHQVPVWIRKIHHSRVRIIRMLTLNSLVFFLCNTPRSVTIISGYIQDSLGVTRWDADPNIQVFSAVLILVNSCINPIIYNLTNKNYRQAFREVFVPSCCSPSRPNQRSTVFHLQIIAD